MGIEGMLVLGTVACGILGIIKVLFSGGAAGGAARQGAGMLIGRLFR